MSMIVIKGFSALILGAVTYMFTGSSGILWAPGFGSGGNLIFTFIALGFGWMLPTEIAFWKAWKAQKNAAA